MTEETLFSAALKITAASERRAFLEGACAGDDALRRRVERLVEAHERTLGVLDRSARPRGGPESAAGPDAVARPGPRVGAVIAGRYKLIEEIDVGGMGAVWKAEQTEPVRRFVALKLIKPGMDTRTVLARFDAERQALALMEHPNIARVLDGGTTDDGRPFFVMEFVKGVPFTRYCDDARLSVAERLALFVPVCQAVQHAHTKGVIHRDLKPSNILVCLYDGSPVPKVIDFGLAKAIRQPLTERTLHTAHGVVLGTPLYMSPEQAEINNIDVDARADVYALGVILYELLTGTTPLERGRFHEAALHEMLRVIKEEDPPRPSARLSGNDSLPSLAALRKLEPLRLTKLVRGELDWIVMKCLEKDRSRRYDTPSGLARDVERYLSDESVEACPPSAGYRLRKFLRRNRGPMLAASVIFLLLVAGIVGTTWGLIRADRAWKAEAERAEGERKAKDQAEKRLVQVEKGIEILGAVFNDLNPRDEAKGGKPLRTILGDRLAQAADQIEGAAVGDPLSVSTLQQRLGVSLLHLGLPQRAIPVLEKARATRTAGLGAGHEVTLETSGILAEAYRADGKPAKALPLLEENMKLSMASLGPDAPGTIYCMNNLAGYYVQMGRPAPAIPILEEVVRLQKAKLGEGDPVPLIAMNNLANAYREDGQLDRALPLLEEVLRLRKSLLPPGHISILGSMNNLAEGYRAEGRPDLTLPLLEETVKLIKDAVGPVHPNTLTSMSNLGRAYLAVGQPDRAVPLLEETLKLMKANLSPDHPNAILCMSNLAMAYVDVGRPGQALPLFEEVLKARRAKLADDQRSILLSMRDLAWGYQAVGKLDQALPLFEEVLTSQRASLDPDHPIILTSLYYLAGGYRASNNPERAQALYKEAATGVEKRQFRHPIAGKIIEGLADTQEQLKQFAEAEAWRRKWLAVVRERIGADSLSYSVALEALGADLDRQEKWTDAESVLREALALYDKKAPDSPVRFHAQSLLGGALLGQKKYAEAEPMLIQGYEGTRAREGKLTPTERRRLVESGKPIIRLYEAWGRPEKAAEWRAKMAGSGAAESKP